MKTHSMETGYKYLIFIVVIVCVLSLCSVNFRKVFFFSRQAKTCHTLTVVGMMSSAKNKPFFKGLFRFWQTGVGKLLQQILPALSSAVLIPQLIKDSRTVEALKQRGTRAKNFYYTSNYTQFLPHTF